MKRTRRKFSKEFKLKVILESLKESSTLKELSQKYDLHQNQISMWKRDFISKAGQVIDSKNDTTSSLENKNEKLYEKIGRLQMEIDFLKKKLY